MVKVAIVQAAPVFMNLEASLARAIEYRLAIACVSCDYAPGEAGLRIDSQSASINQLVIIIKIFRLEVSSR